MWRFRPARSPDRLNTPSRPPQVADRHSTSPSAIPRPGTDDVEYAFPLGLLSWLGAWNGEPPKGPCRRHPKAKQLIRKVLPV